MRATEIERNRRHDLGAYYTPFSVAKLISDWAINSNFGSILDPSFGGCSFLLAAVQTLSERGIDNPGRLLYGVDIDPSAKNYLLPLYQAGAQKRQFFIKNFFEEELLSRCPKVSTILGNPPYINYHKIPKSELLIAQHRLREMGISLSGRASYWAYFLIHSLRFLQYGGRIAMLLPMSFVKADYASQLREILSCRFKNTYIIFLQERIFDDTEEQAVLFLGDDYSEQEQRQNITVFDAGSVETLGTILASIAPSLSSIRKFGPFENLYYGLLDAKTLNLYNELSSSEQTFALGELVDVKIGVVTGHNSFFIVPRLKAKNMGLSHLQVRPIITRPSQMKGLTLLDSDIEALLDINKPNCLISLQGELYSLPVETVEYLESADVSIREGTKCKEHKPWYSVPHTFSPQGFIHYMSATWPRIIINDSQATCTNNIHRLTSKVSLSREDWLKIALSSLSTLSQLSSEIHGRTYGGGVLKLEPQEVHKLLIPIADKVSKSFVAKVEVLLRNNDFETANSLVDQELLIKGFGLTSEDLLLLTNARNSFHKRRKGS